MKKIDKNSKQTDREREKDDIKRQQKKRKVKRVRLKEVNLK